MMKAGRRAGKFSQQDVGGAVKGRAPEIKAPLPLQEEITEDDTDLYPGEAIAPPTRSPHSIRNQQKARQIAEDRLNQIATQLLELADELRDLQPDLADALDDAWHSTDEALELLLDETAW